MIENARETGERDETAAEDAHRQARSEAMFLGKQIERLLRAKVRYIDMTYLKAVDLRINVQGQLPTKTDVEQIKRMAWEYRRSMPASPLTPRLPPHDPIVREQGL